MDMVADQISNNFEKFNSLIALDSRADALSAMYDALQSELLTAPASSKVHFHNAFPGGYLDHILNVVEASIKVTKLYKDMGGVIDYTAEELRFAAIHHDLGKLGEVDSPYYIPETSDWHRNTGSLYKKNPDLQYFTVTDRALMMLQKYEIPITDKEWLGIKLSDGLYDESNKSYLINYNPRPMKTILPYIIHWADSIACRVEHDNSIPKLKI